MINPLKEYVRTGVLAVTGSEPFVIRACMKFAQKHDELFLVEATVNQVNQFGGYTGMKPKDYAALVAGIAQDIGYPVERVVLCGDHLGPFIWQHLPEKEAMENSRILVRDYVAAGFRKVHLDPTMRLADDDPNAPLSLEVIARRAADLAKVSEATYAETASATPWPYRPAYIIGSEVPTPGGTEEDEGMQVTKPADLRASIECFKNVFLANGLPQVWEDVVAVVAQIGVEFADETIHDYDHAAALPIVEELDTNYPNLYFESHSSDYQTTGHLAEMARDRVGILKVGPGLTFAMREGLFSLAFMERELQPLHGYQASDFIAVLENAMLTGKPNYWEKYYHGTPAELALKRKYSFSDRSRYYFARPEVVAAMRKLLANLDGIAIPLSVLSQFMPCQFSKVRRGALENRAASLVEDKVISVLEEYYAAIRREGRLGRVRK